MVNENVRCRLKWGDKEFEIEGIANKELNQKIDYLYDTFKRAIAEVPAPPEDTEGKKGKRRGGRKPPFYKNNIQRIIEKEPEWFVEKDAGSVAEKLRTEYGVPGAQEIQVSNALLRLFTEGLLTRKEDKGKYLYSVTTLNKT